MPRIKPGLLFPDPLSFERIWLEDENSPTVVGATARATKKGRGGGVGKCARSAVPPINYTDCMESSVIRFMQAVLFDPCSLSHSGVPTKVDLELVHTRVNDPDVVAFFVHNPEILEAKYYNPKRVGFETRQAWARLVNKRPAFNYKRATNGVYKNDAVQGKVEVPVEVEMLIEMEPCLHNILNVFRHFLGVDFTELDQFRPSSWSKNVEAHSKDVSALVQNHFDAASRQLSRPGMMLQFQVHVRDPCDGARFFVNVDIAVNGRVAWRWVLTRCVLDVGGTETARRLTPNCVEDKQGKPFFLTSKHSHIESYGRGRTQHQLPQEDSFPLAKGKGKRPPLPKAAPPKAIFEGPIAKGGGTRESPSEAEGQ